MFLVLFLFSQHLFAQEKERYDALLWRISGNGLSKPSHLYGTMHVSKKVAYHLSEEFFVALEGSDMLALELDPEDWLGEMSSSEWFTALAEMGAAKQGSDDLYHDAFRMDFPDRRTYAQALALDPEVVNDLLYRMNASNANHEEDTYLDLFIFQCGSRSGKPVVGLETMQHSLSQLMRAAFPDGRDPDEERMKRRREAYARGLDPEQAIEDSYREQDLDRMDTLFDLTASDDRMRKYVIDERNTTFLESLLPLMGKGSVFAGVGAMHLPGPNGMIALLRAKGYTVEPVHGNVSNRSRAQQRKHEQAYRPVEWRTAFAADSLFTLELPAPLFPLPTDRSGRMLVSADMVNGSHFLISRIPTYAAYRGLSADDVLLQIDSALYEGVPGRIERTQLGTTNNGWPQLDVRSMDRLGRVVHHRVVVTPFEVVVFERTMRSLSQAEKDGERVFASIRFRDVPAGAGGRWSPSYGGCAMDLPSVRSVHEEPTPIVWAEQARVERLFTVEAAGGAGEGVLAVGCHFADAVTLEQDTFELAQLAVHGGAAIGLREVKHDPVAPGGTRLRGRGLLAGGDTVHFQVALDADRYTLLAVRAPQPQAAHYLDAYTAMPLRPVRELATFKDTLMHFSVRTASVNDCFMARIGSLGPAFREIIQGEMDRNRREMDREESTVLYRSVHGPEAVRVNYERFTRFRTVKDEQEFWDDQVRSLDRSGLMRVVDRRTTGEPERRRLELMLQDSASTRAIRVVMQQCPGALYTLSTTADPGGAISAWADSFLVSFHPDTVFSEGILVPKGGVLLEWLTSADSTHAAKARNAIAEVTYTDADAKALIAYITSPAARDRSTGRRILALEQLGGVHDPAVVPFLVEQYRSAGDSIGQRFAALEALARQLRPQAANAFIDLITADPPLTTDDWRTWGLFAPWYDSLEVARILFPKAWDLRVFPEFEPHVVRLAAALQDRGLLPAAQVTARKGELLVKARAELKRAVASFRQRESGASASEEYDEYEDPLLATERDHAWGTELYLSSEKELMRAHVERELGPGTEMYLAYLHLLLPSMDDPAVRALFDMALGSGSATIELETAAMLQEHKRPVPEGLWDRYARRDDTRLWTYRTLKALGAEDRFDRALLTDEQNARAYISSGSPNMALDSLQAVGTRTVRTRYGTYTLHGFTWLTGSDEEPGERTFAVVGVPDGSSPPFTRMFVRYNNEQLGRKDDVAEAFDEMAERITYLGRKRYRDSNGMGRGMYSDY
ncbi:MAG: TraB/GumN family protein [Flavobacteriales bacterium]|nr:TraB/GumN family protein [Flavobacteriales bacterium]